jgi:predicted transcriptional regulator YheO
MAKTRNSSNSADGANGTLAPDADHVDHEIPASSSLEDEHKSEAERVFSILEPVLTGLAATFGRNCEVVLHDFHRPDGTIVAIAGDVTGRHVGGSFSQIGMSIIAAGDEAEPLYLYVTRAPNGRILKSATIPLRDSLGHVFGALCVNYDITDLRMVSSVIEDLAGSLHEAPRQVAFDDDVAVVINRTIQEEEVALGRSIDRNDRATRIEIIRALERRGMFSLQRSAPQVAEHLRISRATLYAYLREVRAEEDGQEQKIETEGTVD